MNFEGLDINPGDVKYVYVVLSDKRCKQGYVQKIAKGIYLYKNLTWYVFSIMEEDTPIISVDPHFVFDTKEQIEAFVKRNIYES